MMRGLVLAATMLCACEGGPARVDQPNVFTKSALDGNWRYEVTLVDAPPLPIEKIADPVVRFEVLEDYLLVRDGGDEPLAAWKIYAHFDDPPRGPDPNEGVIYESDLRPWYRRVYARIDFSIDLVPALAGWSAWPSEISVAPVAYFVDVRRDGAPSFIETTTRLLVGDALVLVRHRFTRN